MIARSLRPLPVAACLLLCAVPAASALTATERAQYVASGKYMRDVGAAAKPAVSWIRKRAAKTAPVVRACDARGFRVGKADPGPATHANYAKRVKVVRRPAVPKPPKGAVTKAVCAKTERLAVAFDIDETVTSSFRVGAGGTAFDALTQIANQVLGRATVLGPVHDIYDAARANGVAVFIITAAYDPITADPIFKALASSGVACRPPLKELGACEIDFDTYDFRAVRLRNLQEQGYTDIAGLYMRPPGVNDKGVVKDAQRAEIERRRGYRVIAMVGDHTSDLDGGFFDRRFLIPTLD